jgi:hypothetical protein
MHKGGGSVGVTISDSRGSPAPIYHVVMSESKGAAERISEAAPEFTATAVHRAP